MNRVFIIVTAMATTCLIPKAGGLALAHEVITYKNVIHEGNSQPPEGMSEPGMRPPGPRGDRRGPPLPRRRTEIQKADLVLQPATVAPITDNMVMIEVIDDERRIRSNNIAGHETGRFPGPGNPNAITERNINFVLPVAPKANEEPTFFPVGKLGVAVNGVIFDPQAAEWYMGNRRGWQYDALSGAAPLGLDEHNAHVQPDGMYHYHGFPNGLLEELGFDEAAHSPLIGWALDGFPIYALTGFGSDGGVEEKKSGYVLKKGDRPSGGDQPGGYYDGTFLDDYEYVKSAATLDECNGAFVITPEFSGGTYAYFLTRSFPVIPRCFRGTPVEGAIPTLPGTHRP